MLYEVITYYWKAFVGWTNSTVLYGPLNESEMNGLGYFSAEQVHKIEQDKVRRDKFALEGERKKEQVKAHNEFVKLQNPFYLIYKLSPASSGVDALIDYSRITSYNVCYTKLLRTGEILS